MAFQDYVSYWAGTAACASAQTLGRKRIRDMKL